MDGQPSAALMSLCCFMHEFCVPGTRALDDVAILSLGASEYIFSSSISVTRPYEWHLFRQQHDSNCESACFYAF